MGFFLQKPTNTVMTNQIEDVDIIEDVSYIVTQPDKKHYLKIDAFYGCSHTTSFLNTEGKVVIISNQNNDGFIGLGRDIQGKTIKIRTRALADIDDLGMDRIRLEYFIDDQNTEERINKYDRPESHDHSPLLKFTITFK